MKLKFALIAAAALMFGACSGSKTQEAEAQAEEPATEEINILGTWNIEHIVLNDSTSLTPAELDSVNLQTIEFNDSAFSIHTNCNTIIGGYTLSGDSLRFADNMGSTMMACPDMQSEEMLNAILPAVRTVVKPCPCRLRLQTEDPAEYIVIRKAVMEQADSTECQRACENAASE